MKMTFQEIRIIATGPCIANQLRDVNTICRRSWYIAAHIWKIYDFKIEVVPFIFILANHVHENQNISTYKYIHVRRVGRYQREVIRICKSKKNKQHNGQKKKDKH